VEEESYVMRNFITCSVPSTVIVKPIERYRVLERRVRERDHCEDLR
jgi:hypothetical protein